MERKNKILDRLIIKKQQLCERFKRTIDLNTQGNQTIFVKQVTRAK